MASRPTAEGQIDTVLSLIPDLTRAARAMTRDPAVAEDIVQETLLRVIARLKDGAGIDDLRPYLMTVARNIVRRGRGVPHDVPLTEVPDLPAPATLPARMALRDVLGALARLPPVDRRLVLRHAVKGQSYARIAEAEDLPIGTVMSRLSRGRARLRAECGLPGSGSATPRPGAGGRT